MHRLTYDRLYGIWAGVTMAWNEDYSFDEKTYITNVQTSIKSKAHGIYTTGTTGEFYAVEYDDFCRMVDIVNDLCGKAHVPLQIGCCADSTRKVIKLLEYANSKKDVGGAQFVLPYWIEMSDKEIQQFFKDIYKACPEMPLVHYNNPASKRFLGGKDYRILQELAPNLIGVKYAYAGSHFGALQEAMRLTPNLSYFVVESCLVSAMQLGARGCYSSLIATNPKWVLDMFEKAQQGQWEQAIKMQQHVSRFFNELEDFITENEQAISDPASDKGVALASGCFVGHPRCMPPYIGWSNEFVKKTRTWIMENYPEFVYAE